MSERWRKVPGWPYEASSDASVRRAGDCQPLTPAADRNGYLRLTLTDGRRRKTLGVHQIVALAWHGPPEVRHLNGDNQDNRPGNLAWGSRRDNERDKRSLRVSGQERKEGKEEKERVVSRPLTAVTGVTSGTQGA